MTLDQNKLTGIHILETATGVELEVLANEYEELPLDDGTVNFRNRGRVPIDG